MKIVYTKHLLNRIGFRKIPHDLPKNAYLSSEEILFDSQTKHYIALSKKDYFGKLRTLAVTFDRFTDRVELITIHPIEDKDKIQRVKSGRWVKQ